MEDSWSSGGERERPQEGPAAERASRGQASPASTGPHYSDRPFQNAHPRTVKAGRARGSGWGRRGDALSWPLPSQSHPFISRLSKCLSAGHSLEPSATRPTARAYATPRNSGYTAPFPLHALLQDIRNGGEETMALEHVCVCVRECVPGCVCVYISHGVSEATFQRSRPVSRDRVSESMSLSAALPPPLAAGLSSGDPARPVPGVRCGLGVLVNVCFSLSLP